jgi:hypothetical protein
MTILQVLPRMPDLSKSRERRVCPFRTNDKEPAYCCGEHCAAFLAVTAIAGACLLIERGGRA